MGNRGSLHLPPSSKVAMTQIDGQEPRSLLQLPSELLQEIVIRAGTGAGGAYCSCKALQLAWYQGMSTTCLAARYFLDRYGQREACWGAYRLILDQRETSRGLFDKHLRADGSAADTVALLKVLQQQGALLKPHLLSMAAQAGDLHMVQHLLATLPLSLEVMTNAVRDAARHGHCDVMRGLLEHARTYGAYAAENDNDTLYLAALGPDHSASVHICRQLLAAGVSTQNDGGDKAMLAAVEACNEELVQMLLANGANPTAFNNAPLQAACELAANKATKGHGYIFQLGWLSCLVGGLPPYPRGCADASRPLDAAVPLRLIRLLLSSGADPRANYSRPLYTVAELDGLDALKLLLSTGVYAPSDKNRAMRAASRAGSTRCVEELLRSGADVCSTEADGASAFDLALQHGHLRVLDLLIQGGYTITDSKRVANALAAAAKSADCKGALDRLITQANVSVSGRAGGEALVAAAGAGAAGGVRALLEAGADVQNFGGRALTEACTSRHKDTDEIVRMLLQAGAASAADGRMAARAVLLAATQERYGLSTRVISMLVQQGNINAREACGGEALVAMARAGDLTSVRALLAAGVDVGKYGGRAIVEARSSGYSEIVNILHVAMGTPVPQTEPRGGLFWSGCLERRAFQYASMRILDE